MPEKTAILVPSLQESADTGEETTGGGTILSPESPFLSCGKHNTTFCGCPVRNLELLPGNRRPSSSQ